MNIEEILDMLDELLDRAWNLPLSGGRCVIDAEKVREMVDDIRLNLPDEIKQAKACLLYTSASLLRPFYLYNLSGSLTGITVFVYAALIVAVMVMSCITIIQRFSKTMLGPEGYLMHTLPVSATVHIFSKLITAMVIVVAGFLVGTISMLIIAADSSFFLLLRSFWEEFILFLYDLFGQNGLIVGLELILLSLSKSACGILMVYTAACIGHLFYRGRAVIAVFSLSLIHIYGSDLHQQCLCCQYGGTDPVDSGADDPAVGSAGPGGN